MPRDEIIPVGGWGTFSTPKWNEQRGYYQVSAGYRDGEGVPLRRVWGKGVNAKAAERDLTRRLRAETPRYVGVILKPTTKNAVLFEEWYKHWVSNTKAGPCRKKQIYKEIWPSTHKQAKKSTMVLMRSTLAKMSIGATKAPHLRAHLDPIQEKTPAKAEFQRWIIAEAFALAESEAVIPHSPAATLKRFTGDDPDPRQFTPEEMEQYWELEAQWYAKPRSGTPPNPLYRDVNLLHYELGGRTGEPLAVRWDDDVDLDTGEVTVSGNVCEVTVSVAEVPALIKGLSPEQYVVREDWQTLAPDARVMLVYRKSSPKNEDSVRTVRVSEKCLAMLRRRKLAAPPGSKLVFLSTRGHIVRPTLVQARVRDIVRGTDLDWVKPGTLRKTAAKRVDDALGLPAAQALIGHVEGSTKTRKHYTGKRKPKTVDVSDVLWNAQ